MLWGGGGLLLLVGLADSSECKNFHSLQMGLSYEGFATDMHRGRIDFGHLSVGICTFECHI